MPNKPFFLGITGGAGAGKSLILSLLRQRESTEVLEADRIAEELCRPGTDCFQAIREAFPDPALYRPDGSMDRKRFAERIFSDENERKRLEHLVHPAVKRYIKDMLKERRSQGSLDLLVLEAALLLESGYQKICDEIWYIRADREVRKSRLIRTRGYSPEKAEQIFREQLPEEAFLAGCDAVIDNNGTEREAAEQLYILLRERVGTK